MSHPLRFAVVLAVPFLATAIAPGARGDDKPAEPKIISSSPKELAAMKAKLLKDPGPLKPALERIIANADKALKQRPVSVLDKKKSVDGADAHDYVSFAPYFWPDPTKPDGLPYIRKDGKTNNDVQQGDKRNFGSIKSAVYALALGYYFTGDEKYADHAMPLLRVWFLEPKTRMNPNFNHGQAIPGTVNGRAAGLIEFRDMPQLIDALGFLEGSASWTALDRAGMRKWLGEYYDWLITSPIGKAEGLATNNHGTWYDVQAMAMALYLDRTDDARRLAEGFRERRIAAQIQADGSQPRELGRANSWGYSVFNVVAMMAMAELAERTDVDLWHYRAKDGQSIRLALDYLASYMDTNKKWTAGGAKEFPIKAESLAGPFQRAIRGLDAKAYTKLLNSLPPTAWQSQPERILHAK